MTTAIHAQICFTMKRLEDAHFQILMLATHACLSFLSSVGRCSSSCLYLVIWYDKRNQSTCIVHRCGEQYITTALALYTARGEQYISRALALHTTCMVVWRAVQNHGTCIAYISCGVVEGRASSQQLQSNHSTDLVSGQQVQTQGVWQQGHAPPARLVTPLPASGAWQGPSPASALFY
jgi:hypothetical protein